jgi:uncharacterized protein (DUF1778 family)
MNGAAKRRGQPLSMRLPEGDIAIIDRAAQLRGRSRADFVRESAVRAAEAAIMDSVLPPMAPEVFKAFVEAISAPAAQVPEMVTSLQHTAPWEKPSAVR